MPRDPLIDRSQAARLAFFEQERDLFHDLVTHGQSPEALLIAQRSAHRRRRAAGDTAR